MNLAGRVNAGNEWKQVYMHTRSVFPDAIYSPVYIQVRSIFSGMFVFAHLVSGLLLGLCFCTLIQDRRAIPLCVVSSLLPDLVDKPLALIFPELSSGRTIFHALFIVIIAMMIALVIVQKRYLLYGIAVACSIFIHQVLDAMWLLPTSWAYPLSGPFPLVATPDYTGYYLRLEITTPSEWIFLLVAVMLIAMSFPRGGGKPERRYFLWIITAALAGGMGILMAGTGLLGAGNTFFAPTYSAVATCMAGILSLAAAGMMLQWQRLHPLIEN